MKSEVTKSYIQVTQKRSLIGKPEAVRKIIRGLGLRKINHSVQLRNTPAIRGMIEHVQHLVKVEVYEGDIALWGKRHQ